MAWKLRFYDESGAELGRVTADPFDFEVAGSAENRAELAERIRRHDATTERTGGSRRYTDPETGETVVEHWDGVAPITDWKDRLERLGAELVAEFGVASYTLAAEPE